jgi:hypothetical protein
MSRASTGTTIRAGKPQPDVYTALAAAAVIVLAVGVGYLWYTNVAQTQAAGQQFQGQGTGMNPFYTIEE